MQYLGARRYPITVAMNMSQSCRANADRSQLYRCNRSFCASSADLPISIGWCRAAGRRS